MRTMNERPVCHRSEDLVTYLYNEASAADAQDFASHVEACEACHAELAVFNQVHESILLWRDQALGAAFSPAPQAAPAVAEANDSRQFVRPARKLPAFAALREFFSVSPLWLRGATGLAALLLCVLAVLVVMNSGRKSAQVANSSDGPKTYTETQLKNEVAKRVDQQMSDFRKAQKQPPDNVVAGGGQKTAAPQTSFRRELASNRFPSRSQRRLTRAEREQLAADLRLMPGRDDEELPFVFPDEPNMSPNEPNQ
jgi:anti-sigma factor RsiW